MLDRFINLAVGVGALISSKTGSVVLIHYPSYPDERDKILVAKPAPQRAETAQRAVIYWNVGWIRDDYIGHGSVKPEYRWTVQHHASSVIKKFHKRKEALHWLAEQTIPANIVYKEGDERETQ